MPTKIPSFDEASSLLETHRHVGSPNEDNDDRICDRIAYANALCSSLFDIPVSEASLRSAANETCSDPEATFIITCGLPLSGKTWTARTVCRMMCWRGINCRVFSADVYRQAVLHGRNQVAEASNAAASQRERDIWDNAEVATSISSSVLSVVLQDAIVYASVSQSVTVPVNNPSDLRSGFTVVVPRVAVIDADCLTHQCRVAVAQYIHSHFPGASIMFVSCEITCPTLAAETAAAAFPNTADRAPWPSWRRPCRNQYSDPEVLRSRLRYAASRWEVPSKEGTPDTGTPGGVGGRVGTGTGNGAFAWMRRINGCTQVVMYKVRRGIAQQISYLLSNADLRRPRVPIYLCHVPRNSEPLVLPPFLQKLQNFITSTDYKASVALPLDDATVKSVVAELVAVCSQQSVGQAAAPVSALATGLNLWVEEESPSCVQLSTELHLPSVKWAVHAVMPRKYENKQGTEPESPGPATKGTPLADISVSCRFSPDSGMYFQLSKMKSSELDCLLGRVPSGAMLDTSVDVPEGSSANADDKGATFLMSLAPIETTCMVNALDNLIFELERITYPLLICMSSLHVLRIIAGYIEELSVSKWVDPDLCIEDGCCEFSFDGLTSSVVSVSDNDLSLQLEKLFSPRKDKTMPIVVKTHFSPYGSTLSVKKLAIIP